MTKPSGHGNDVCSICDGVFDPDSLLDIDEMEFELICPVCTRKRLALIPKLVEACRKALEVLDCNWQQHRGKGTDDAEHAARHKLRETIMEVLDGSDNRNAEGAERLHCEMEAAVGRQGRGRWVP